MTMQLNVVSFGGNNINDGSNYTAKLLSPTDGLPDVMVNQAQREGNYPAVAGVMRQGRTMPLLITVLDASNARTLRKNLFGYFDPDDETPKALIVEDDNGTNDRYVMCICKSLHAVPNSKELLFRAELVTHKDTFWRKVTASTDTWSLTATGQTKTVTNNGDLPAYPIFTFTPTSAITGSWLYRVPIRVFWNSNKGVSKYWTDITNDAWNTAALIAAGKMQSDGDDLRVWIDGVEEVNRYLGGIDTTTTQVWVNMDFQPKQNFRLETAIASSGAVSKIEASFSIPATGARVDPTLPGRGLLVIDSEEFSYTGWKTFPSTSRNRRRITFTGVTRAARSSAMAAHSVNATVYWLQHDIWIYYGNSTVGAPETDDELIGAPGIGNSTNTSWHYFNFGSDQNTRPWSWQRGALGSRGQIVYYTSTQFAYSVIWARVGIKMQQQGSQPINRVARWFINHPLEITNINITTDAEKYAENLSLFEAYVESSQDETLRTWVKEYTIPAPTVASTWQTWGVNQAVTSGTTAIALSLYPATPKIVAETIIGVEMSEIVLTLNSSNTPTATIGSEEDAMLFQPRLTNNTTGDAVEIDTLMTINESLKLNTDTKTLIHVDNNLSIFSALRLLNNVRLHWLPLQAGANQFKIDLTGLTGLDVDFEWEERFYE